MMADFDGEPEKEKGLSAETVEEIRKRILFGESGYRRPPQRTQFKKGQSGNPKGRPKTKLPAPITPLIERVIAESRREVSIREGDEIRKIPMADALLRSEQMTAIKGNAFAQKHSLEFLRRAEIDWQRHLTEKIEHWTERKEIAYEKIAKAKACGETPPNIFPHPDDIIIDANGVRIVGPTSEEELKNIHEVLHLIDALLKQDAIDTRCSPVDNKEYKSGTAYSIADMLNSILPKRLRLSETEIMIRMLRYGKIPKRELLKETRRAWRARGMNIRRGQIFSSLLDNKVKVALQKLNEILEDVKLIIESRYQV